jgi:ubiquinone biosynthesis protein COQ9
MSVTEPDWASQTEQRILAAAIPRAPDLGWSPALLAAAAREVGLSPGEAALLLPNGPRDLAALLSRHHDRVAMTILNGVDPKALKIRERIRRGVEARLDAAAADAKATRRWSAFLAMPLNVPLALRLAWESADGLWRWAGDTSTDENHYSKRALLAGILISTLAVRLNAGRDAASAQLAARIENVMAFETWKAKQRPSDLGQRLAAALGRIRYGRG